MIASKLACAVVLAVVPWVTAVAQARFAAADTDQNGLLSRDEVERALPKLAPHFDAIDTNRDGNLSPDELRAYARTRRRAPREERAGFVEHFRRADSDGDGALTRAEAEKALPRIARKFERIDADRDGRLTLDELRAWFAAKRAARGKRA